MNKGILILCLFVLIGCIPKKSEDASNIVQNNSDEQTAVNRNNIEIAKTHLSNIAVEKINIDWNQDIELLGRPGGKVEEILWKMFINQPYEQQFNDITAENWSTIYELYKSKIVDLAEQKKFPSDIFDKYLSARKPDQNTGQALLPIGAYITNYENEEVFIMIFKCGFTFVATDENQKPIYNNFSEALALMISMKDLQIINGTMSC
jgi:hypothetical protein